MSLIDVNPGEAKELVAVESGEYEVSVLGAELKESQNKPGNMMIELSLRVEGEPLAKPVRDWLQLPNSNDDEGTKNRKLLKLSSFCKCMDYDYSSGIETDDLPGLSGRVILGLESSDEFGDQNRVRRYLS